MSPTRKTAQLQIRVSPAEKAAIQRAARHAGADMSSWILEQLLPGAGRNFQRLVAECAGTGEARHGLAELNSFLGSLDASELQDAVAMPPETRLPAQTAAYVASMVEYACGRHAVTPPAWAAAVPALAEPLFGSALASLRLYLLAHSPPPFRRRNIFIDASIGARV